MAGISVWLKKILPCSMRSTSSVTSWPSVSMTGNRAIDAGITENLLGIHQGEIACLDVVLEAQVDIGGRIEVIADVFGNVQVQVRFDQVQRFTRRLFWDLLQRQQLFDKTAGVFDTCLIAGQATFQRRRRADAIEGHGANSLVVVHHGDAIEARSEVLVAQVGIGDAGIMWVPAGVVVNVKRREQRQAVRYLYHASHHLRGRAWLHQRARPAAIVIDLVGQMTQVGLGCRTLPTNSSIERGRSSAYSASTRCMTLSPEYSLPCNRIEMNRKSLSFHPAESGWDWETGCECWRW